MNKYWQHFKTITKHRWVVMKNCFRCGLYWRGLVHDLSKYGFTEFFSSARYFQGSRSPIDAEKEAIGYSLAWQHHKGHNPHHWEYWIDNLGTKENTPLKIPYVYVIEMICDWIGAGQVYSKETWTQHEPLAFYKKVRKSRIIHPDTEKLILTFLKTIDKQGLEAFYETAFDYEDEYENK